MAHAPIQIRKLVNPTEAEINSVIDVIVIAFETTRDPFVTAILGGEVLNRSLSAAMIRCFVRGALVDGEIWVAETDVDEDGKRTKKMVGEALWFLPGKSFMGSEKQLAAVKWEEYASRLKPGVEEWMLDYCLPRLHTWWETNIGPHVLEDNYHIQILSVLPGYQGQFLTGALIRPVAERAVSEGKRVLGEATTARTAELYRAIGCAVLGEETFQSETGEFKLWPVELLPAALDNVFWKKGKGEHGAQSKSRL